MLALDMEAFLMMCPKRVVFVALLLVGLTMPAWAETTTVKGELVTVMCYTKNGDKGRGDAHLSCAQKCAKEGYPLAIVTDDGALYKITGTLSADKYDQLQPLLAKTVVATGTTGLEGKLKTIDASSVVEAK
jgi:predicted lipoprotein with Yx(FWY)xxD motif